MTDEDFMRAALELAREAGEAGEVPVGAIVAKGGEIIGRGYNRPISTCDPTAHAEVVALRDAAGRTANYRLPGAELFVTLEPCVMCLGAILHARIARLVYAASDPKAGACGSIVSLASNEALNHQTLVQGGLMTGDAVRLLQAFFRERRGGPIPSK